MGKSLRLRLSSGGAAGEPRRDRMRGQRVDTTAVAGILISIWAALSCAGKSDNTGNQFSEVTGGVQNASTGGSEPGPTNDAGGAASSTTSYGGAVSTTLTGVGSTSTASTMLLSGGAASSGGTASALTPSGGGSSTTETTSGHSGGTSQSSGTGGMVAVAGHSAFQPSGGASALPERYAQLATQPDWQRFVRLWNDVDQVAPGTSTHVPYANTITSAQRDQWIADLAARLDTVASLGVLNETEILFLRQLTTARIEVMRDGGYRYEMFLHRSPFPFEEGAEDSIGRLEKKLDTLQGLKDRCALEAVAYEAALEQVEREAVTFFVFAQLTEVQVGSDVRVAVPTDFEGAALLSELDRRFEALRNDAGTDAAALAEIDALRARLATIRATVQTLPLLVQMLEPCE